MCFQIKSAIVTCFKEIDNHIKTLVILQTIRGLYYSIQRSASLFESLEDETKKVLQNSKLTWEKALVRI